MRVTNKSMRMLETAAQEVAALCLKGPVYTGLAGALVHMLKQAREFLDSRAVKQQEACCTAALLPWSASHASTVEQLCTFKVAWPWKQPQSMAMSSNMMKTALENLGPVGSPPERSSLSKLLSWAKTLCSKKMPKRVHMLLLCNIEAWFFFQATSKLREGPMAVAWKGSRAHALARLYCEQVLHFEKQHCSQHSADVQTDMLKVELRSMETLVVWVMLCLAHRHAAAEFPGMKKYALPVQPDDLRHLVLRDTQAEQAALVVAGYISAINCSATAGSVFSTRHDSTADLAAEYCAESESLHMKFLEEQGLADERMEAHWQKILQMQERVRSLEDQLAKLQVRLVEKEALETHAIEAHGEAINQAKSDLAHCSDALAEYEIKQGLTALVQPILLPRRAQLLNRSRASADEHLKALTDDQARGFKKCQTITGAACHQAAAVVRSVRGLIKSVKQRIAAATVPPPHVYQPLPDPRSQSKSAMALLFFLYPEKTGSLPLLRQYCCAAQQCMVPMNSSGGPQSTPQTDSEQRSVSWADYYNRAQRDCRYVPRPQRIGVLEGSDQLQLFQKQQPPAQTDFGPKSVMRYSSASAGVWWPDAELSVRLWQGGPIARYACDEYIDPFSVGSDSAVAESFTEPGQYYHWLQVAALKDWSRLCLDGGCCGSMCCKRHSFEDTAPSVEAARGNLVLAQQGNRPEGMSADQWTAFTSLRAYPLQQLRVLCVALREGNLQLESPQVR